MRDQGRRRGKADLIVSLVTVGLMIGIIVFSEVFRLTKRPEILWTVCILIMVVLPAVIFIRFLIKQRLPDKESRLELSDASLKWAEATGKIKGKSMYAIVAGYCRKGIFQSIALAMIISLCVIVLIFVGSAQYEFMVAVHVKYKLLIALAIMVISFIIGGRTDFKQCMTADFRDAVKTAGVDETELNRDFMSGTMFPVHQGFINIGTLYCSSYSKQKCIVLKLEDIEKAVGYFEDKVINGSPNRYYWLEFRVNNKPVFFRMKDETTMKLIISALVIRGIDAKQLK